MQRVNAFSSTKAPPKTHQSHLRISHLRRGGCAQRDRGSCPAFTKRIVSAGHVNCHGDAVCSTGRREAGCSLCNLFIVCQLIPHTSVPHTNFLPPPQIQFSLVSLPSHSTEDTVHFFFPLKGIYIYLLGEPQKKKRKKKKNHQLCCASITAVLTPCTLRLKSREKTYRPHLQRLD